MDILFILLVWFLVAVTIKYPVPTDLSILKSERVAISNEFYTLNNNWIKKSDSGLWEMYISGNGFERGVKEGKLNKELAEKQEIAFVNQLKKMIPSVGMLNYLKYFIAFFNRHLDKYIIEEYKQEIYGESLFASDEFDFIAPKYYRMLNYHAAHDIGHALQDRNMVVGCTAFGAWGNKTEDQSLLIGRNFDFYVGDEFAENKLINFVKPTSGYKFMMVSWAGMIGAVSGMNDKGITVTINASKSEMPREAATPISIVAREILQYAKNITEAFEIAKKRKTFVSESIFIGSTEDNKTATIEKTPFKTELFYSKTDFSVCTNHFQGLGFAKDEINLKNMKESSSMYRFLHLNRMLEKGTNMRVSDAVKILRDQKGIADKNIGFGNEKAINQLIAHHSIIFKPSKLQVWVSTNPFQLGKYVCYDLHKVFAQAPNLKTKIEVYESELTIPADSFLYSKEFIKFNAYKEMRDVFIFSNKHNLQLHLSDKLISDFINCNSEYFETYNLIGNYYYCQKDFSQAVKYFNLALSKEITTAEDREEIQAQISEIERLNPEIKKIKFQF